MLLELGIEAAGWPPVAHEEVEQGNSNQGLRSSGQVGRPERWQDTLVPLRKQFAISI